MTVSELCLEVSDLPAQLSTITPVLTPTEWEGEQEWRYRTMILVMSKVLPLSEVKAKLSEVVDEIVTTHERVTITRNGRPVVMLLSTDDLEAMEETLAILSDPAAVRRLDAGRAAIAAGDIATKDEIEALRDRLRAGSR